MQALLDINLPGYETRIPVFPNQLKVGHEYLHLFVGGLRQRANLRNRRIVHRVPEPQVERVKILQINDQDFGGIMLRFVHFKSADGWTSIAAFRHDTLNTYTRRDNDVFFIDEPMNRRMPLLALWENSGRSTTGGRRTRRRRKISSKTKRK